MINWFFGVFCVILTFAWLQRRKKMKRLQERIPKGNMGWPLIGETLEFIASGHTSHPVSFMDKRKSLYGKVFKTNILGKPVIVSTDWEVNRVILQNDGRTFVPSYPKTVTELLGETSILKMSGSTQRKVHGLVGSFLKSPQFKKLITLETEKSLELNMKNWKEGQRILLQDAVQNVTSEILIRTLVGIGPGHEMNLLKQDFGIFLQGLICLPIKFPGTTLYKSLKAKERMMKLIMNILKKKTERNGSDPATSVLDVLLAERNDLEQILTDKCLCGNTIDFMIPGEESLPTLITLAMKYLSHYPLALQQLTEEHMKLKLEKKHSGEPYNWVDYMTLPFTQNVISETLRMANIVNAVWRESCEDVEIKGPFTQL